jgi:hypothetical protein
MLAQNFKTADELGLSEVAYNALVTVLGMLERGEIDAEHFDMDEWWAPGRDQRGRFCGSVGCIGGWAVFVAERAGHGSECWKSPRPAHPRELTPWNELFYPLDLDAWFATPAQAAHALRNYLISGNPQWALVM